MATRFQIVLAAIVLSLAVVSGADAKVTKIQITTKESPTFGGHSFPGVGQYEKIAGKAFGELDPNDPKNAAIVDLKLARNPSGRIEYSFDFYILKPIDLKRGAHKVMYEAPNRGNKGFGSLNRGAGGNNPGSVVDSEELANTFLLQRGYSLVWSGWDASAIAAPFATTITLPVAKNPDGSAITGPAYEYIVGAGASYVLHYPAATTNRSKATLTHRVRLDDVPQVINATGWTFNPAGTEISLLPAGTAFRPDDIYELAYVAKDPTVNGIGFAAVRDFNAFLQYEEADDAGAANPLAGDVTRVYSYAVSQPARMLNDFRNLGFNQAENGKIVFDGMLQWIGAGAGINMNYRFSQPGRTQRNRQDQLYVESVFPFANQRLADPITGKTAGRYDACTRSHTCPHAMEVYSSNEYWVKGASLLHTDPTGQRDLPDHPMARLYLLSSLQHGGFDRGCQQPGNPLDSTPVLRALWDALDRWSTAGVAPPPSMVPRLANGTLVPPTAVGFPNIPGATYTGLKTTRYLLNYGADFYKTGIMTINPPVITPPMFDNPKNGRIYPSYVPKTDIDGNDSPGVRLPDVTVPLATYTGWGLRAGMHASDGCEGVGQKIAFPKTKADRLASGDPRLSIEERYPSLAVYISKVKAAIEDLVARRLMLREDAPLALDRLVNEARRMGVSPTETTPN
ncbi:MAG TPA: alpha/beta hydrolase domain-containing protein [Vicinamibacterales bacterium]|nr:alpha/beta hydrolase domain-containing protein [Vicinamibacterales bacterium]